MNSNMHIAHVQDSNQEPPATTGTYRAISEILSTMQTPIDALSADELISALFIHGLAIVPMTRLTDRQIFKGL
jgi:hypothetical protein